MRNPYLYVITCLLAFALVACAGGAQSPVADVDSDWTGRLNGGVVSIPFTMSLSQEGTNLTGTLSMADSPAIPVSGEVEDNRVTISSGYRDVNLRVGGTVNGDTMTGTMTLNLAGQPITGDFTATR